MEYTYYNIGNVDKKIKNLDGYNVILKNLLKSINN
jgi:hypothetical protein